MLRENKTTLVRQNVIQFLWTIRTVHRERKYECGDHFWRKMLIPTRRIFTIKGNDWSKIGERVREGSFWPRCPIKWQEKDSRSRNLTPIPIWVKRRTELITQHQEVLCACVKTTYLLLFMVYLTMLLVAQSVQRRMIRLLIDNELGSMW